MDIPTILRDLWRLRIFVAVVCVFALLGAAAVKFKLPSLNSRQYQVGVASAHILIDTPNSQIVNVAPRGSATTAARADLLASLMIDGAIKATIAQQAGLHPSQLVGVTNAAVDPSVAGVAAAPAATPGPRAFVLTTQVLTNSAGDELPIIEVDAQAPNRAGAAKLANAAITGLAQYLDSKAAQERIPGADRLQVTGTGVPQAASVARGPSNLIVILIFVVVFVLGCASILGARGLSRGWRAAAAREQLDGLIADDGPLHDDGRSVDVVLPSLEVSRASRQQRRGLLRRSVRVVTTSRPATAEEPTSGREPCDSTAADAPTSPETWTSAETSTSAETDGALNGPKHSDLSIGTHAQRGAV